MQTPIMITPELISAKCPVRPSFGHKGTFGRALICAGTPGMGGAAYMAAASALRSGAGLVYVLTEPDLLSPLMTLCPQAIGLAYMAPTRAVVPMMKSNAAVVNSTYINWFSDQLPEKNSCLIGPGIPPTSDKLGIMIRLAAKNSRHLVLDAGALTYLANDPEAMNEVSLRISRGLAPAVLTPHRGEFARLIPGFTEKKMNLASAFAEEKGITLVLKSNETNIFTSDGKWYSNRCDNSGMAKGGSGDVLAGLLTGFLAQGMTEEDASVCAVGIHSMAGELCAADNGRRAMLPTMLWEYYGTCFKKLKWEEGMENDG